MANGQWRDVANGGVMQPTAMSMAANQWGIWRNSNINVMA
jgi:hypothetical protein